MQQTFISFFPVLLLLLLHERITVAHSIKQQKTYCSSTKNWACNLTESLDAPDWVIQASKSTFEQSPQEYLTSDFNDLLLHSAYQTPVDDKTGKLYVALRLDWRLNKEFIQSKNVTFWLRINQIEHDETAISTIYMKIYGYQNEENIKKGRILFHTDFQAFIDKKLQIGRTYDFTLIYRTDDGVKTLISSKTLDIPMIHLDAEDNRTIHCDAENIEKSRKIAARWVSAIYTEERHISHSAVITFYAAPKWFCFDSYVVRLLKDDSILKSVTVTNDDLYRNGSNWMANVTFSGIPPNISHIVTIKPNEYRKNDETTCLCRISSSCNCVLTKSRSFELEDIGNNVYGKVLEEKVLAKHRSKSSEKETKKKEMKPLIIVFLIFSIIAAILIIVFLLLCLYRTLKRSSKWQKTLLLKASGSGESLTPLIKTPPVQKIFILNPNVEKSEFVTEIAHFLQSKGLTVFYFEFDSKLLEENAFYYVHKAIADSDKIILFHGEKTQKFMEDGKIIRDRISSNHFDNAFIIALSLLKLNDTKILHSNFIDDDSSSNKPLIAETIYTLPRDLSYLFQGLRLQTDQTSINHLINSYNVQKDTVSNEVENGVICCNTSQEEYIKNDVEESDSVINSIGIIENNNGKTDPSELQNTDSGFHSL